MAAFGRDTKVRNELDENVRNSRTTDDDDTEKRHDPCIDNTAHQSENRGNTNCHVLDPEESTEAENAIETCSDQNVHRLDGIRDTEAYTDNEVLDGEGKTRKSTKSGCDQKNNTENELVKEADESVDTETDHEHTGDKDNADKSNQVEESNNGIQITEDKCAAKENCSNRDRNTVTYTVCGAGDMTDNSDSNSDTDDYSTMTNDENDVAEAVDSLSKMANDLSGRNKCRRQNDLSMTMEMRGSQIESHKIRDDENGKESDRTRKTFCARYDICTGIDFATKWLTTDDRMVATDSSRLSRTKCSVRLLKRQYYERQRKQSTSLRRDYVGLFYFRSAAPEVGSEARASFSVSKLKSVFERRSQGDNVQLNHVPELEY